MTFALHHIATVENPTECTHMAKVEKQRKCAMYLKIQGIMQVCDGCKFRANTHLSYLDVCWQGRMHEKRMSCEKTGVEMIKEVCSKETE